MVNVAHGEAVRIATPPAASRLRVHTPPAPRWGAKEDGWAPFTPRRSSRVAAQRHPSPLSPESPTRISRKPAPIDRMRKVRHLSPASSGSEDDLRNTKATRNTVFEVDDSQINALPTPVKTPRTKRQLPKEILNSASRVLFHGRLAKVDDAMPLPKKVRKSKALSLNPFADDEVAPSNTKIEVYEDSKERVPTVKQDEDNPFLSKSSKPTHGSSARSRRRTQRDAKLEEAVRKEEGLIYVFRGKKIFKKFGDDHEETAQDDNLSDQELQRRAGGSPAPPPSRTGIKPRILFPNEEQRKAREATAEDADEEALTDIEVPLPSTNRTETVDTILTPTATTTEADAESKPADPAIQNSIQAESNEAEVVLPSASQTSETSDITNKHLSNTKRPRASSPFDKWSRTKPSVTAPSEVKSRKRGASPLQQSSKRIRSDAL